jgi:hypothetical protein
MPAYTSDPRGLGAFNIQAEVNWGSAWPEGGNDINLDRENYFIGLLSQTGKKYVPTISPLFASHMSYKVSSTFLSEVEVANDRTLSGEEIIGYWLRSLSK